MSPVFPTLTVAKPLVTEGTVGCPMKGMDLIFPLTWTLWFPEGQVVWLQQAPLKVKQFFEKFKNAENCHI